MHDRSDRHLLLDSTPKSYDNACMRDQTGIYYYIVHLTDMMIAYY